MIFKLAILSEIIEIRNLLIKQEFTGTAYLNPKKFENVFDIFFIENWR
jgi:hypothetical protein